MPTKLPVALPRLAFIPVAIAAIALISSNAMASEACSAHSEFSCPNCGGITVEDCTYCEGYTFTDQHYDLCYDRKLFHVKDNEPGDSDNHYPFLWNDIVASIIWFLTAGIATAAGLGGGGVYVPLGNILLRFPPKAASGLSQASMFGATLGCSLVNLRNRHPDQFIRDSIGTPSKDHPGRIVPYEHGKGPAEIERDRAQYLAGGDGKHKFYTQPVIDYDMALFLSPMEMAGAVTGVIIQSFMPNWLYLIFAIVVLGFTSFKAAQKFLSAHKADKERIKMVRMLTQAEDADKGTEDEPVESSRSSTPVTFDDQNGKGQTETVEEGTVLDVSMDEQKCPASELEIRRQFLEEDARQFPVEKIAYLCVLWIGLSAITLLKGGKGAPSILGVTCEDPGFYAMLAAQFAWPLLFVLVFGYKIVQKTKKRIAVNYPFDQHDILWDGPKCRMYAGCTFFAGILAGMIGVGAGYFLGPLMLSMGVHPAVSAATNAAMIFLTSSSVALIFVLSGIVPWEYAVYFLTVCALGSMLLKPRIDNYAKKSGRMSILIGALAMIIGVSTLGCIYILFANLVKVDWCLDGFRSFCPASHSSSYCDEIVFK